jgi:hypothetical protein
MNEVMQKTLDAMKEEQKRDEQSLARCENQLKDLEVKLRERGYCIQVLEKALGR